MSESESGQRSRAERSVAAQERYVVPILLAVAVIVVALVWAAGGIPWWIAVPVLALGAFAVAGRIRARTR